MHALYLARRGASALPLYLLITLAIAVSAQAQDSKDLAVLLSATTIKSPRPTITIHWNRDPYATSYFIYRKLKSDPGFPQDPLITLDSNAAMYVDNDVEIGKGYEYQVFKQCIHKFTDTSGLSYYGTGYIYAGIDLLPPASRGKVLLLIDSTMATPLTNEIGTLERDMMREGWIVVRRLTPRAETFNGAAVKGVKGIVMEEYNRQPGNLKAVLIVGRVPVPYSGKLNPDGHDDHLGAWPADGYYGDVDGNWTDASIIDTAAGRAENRNIPGDGKFDQTQFPTAVDLQVGRVDFYNMPAFHDSETELLRKYLNKDHLFRTGKVNARLAGIVDDNFPASSYQEAFASAGWRNISLFGGDTSVAANDWFTTLGGSDTYLWAYGCGGGWYAGAGGIGATPDFAAKPVNAVFTMLFGSYFGDWDVQDNFLRASIAGGPSTLTCAWVARPQWYFHHMALGETIGYSTVLSQNNATTYIPNVYFTSQYPNGLLVTYGNRFTHIALMGDPTLRAQMSTIALPETFEVTVPAEGFPRLTWSPSAGAVDGYLIYRSANGGAFTLLTGEPVTKLIYYDSTAKEDSVTYMLQPVVRRQTASGTYYDGPAPMTLGARLAAVPSRIEHGFTCMVAPNPASNHVDVVATLDEPAIAKVEIYNIAGERVRTLQAEQWDAGFNQMRWDLRDDRGAHVPAGIYVMRVMAGARAATAKVVVRP